MAVAKIIKLFNKLDAGLITYITKIKQELERYRNHFLLQSEFLREPLKFIEVVKEHLEKFASYLEEAQTSAKFVEKKPTAIWLKRFLDDLQQLDKVVERLNKDVNVLFGLFIHEIEKKGFSRLRSELIEKFKTTTLIKGMENFNKGFLQRIIPLIKLELEEAPREAILARLGLGGPKTRGHFKVGKYDIKLDITYARGIELSKWAHKMKEKIESLGMEAGFKLSKRALLQDFASRIFYYFKKVLRTLPRFIICNTSIHIKLTDSKEYGALCHLSSPAELFFSISIPAFVEIAPIYHEEGISYLYEVIEHELTHAYDYIWRKSGIEPLRFSNLGKKLLKEEPTYIVITILQQLNDLRIEGFAKFNSLGNKQGWLWISIPQQSKEFRKFNETLIAALKAPTEPKKISTLAKVASNIHYSYGLFCVIAIYVLRCIKRGIVPLLVPIEQREIAIRLVPRIYFAEPKDAHKILEEHEIRLVKPSNLGKKPMILLLPKKELDLFQTYMALLPLERFIRLYSQACARFGIKEHVFSLKALKTLQEESKKAAQESFKSE